MHPVVAIFAILFVIAGCSENLSFDSELEKYAGEKAGMEVAIKYCDDDPTCEAEVIAIADWCADETYPAYLQKFADYTPEQQIEYFETMTFALKQMMARCMIENSSKWSNTSSSTASSNDA